MSYSVSASLQAAVYQALAADPGLSAMVGTAVFDQAPEGTVPGTFVSLGPETVRDAPDSTAAGSYPDFVVSVVSDATGFATAKAAAGAVCDVLIDAPLALTRGLLIGLQFRGARATRTRNDTRRRIDLRFRARVQDS